jgi:uncharacterized cupin superfamily protein
MARVRNIAEPEFVYDPDAPEGFRSGMMRFGAELGAQRTGSSVYELPPGQSMFPYHYEYGEEEWLLVLAGRPMLRTPDGTRELAPWDAVFFPEGPDGAHRVHNDTDETVRVLMYSTVSPTAVAIYPDSGKVGVFVDGEDEQYLSRDSTREYWDGET